MGAGIGTALGGGAFLTVDGCRSGAVYGTAGVEAAAVGDCGLAGLSVIGAGAVMYTGGDCTCTGGSVVAGVHLPSCR